MYVNNEEGLKERIKNKEKAKEKGTKEQAAFLAIQEWISTGEDTSLSTSDASSKLFTTHNYTRHVFSPSHH